LRNQQDHARRSADIECSAIASPIPMVISNSRMSAISNFGDPKRVRCSNLDKKTKKWMTKTPSLLPLPSADGARSAVLFGTPLP
jgi:hypothetical protein